MKLNLNSQSISELLGITKERTYELERMVADMVTTIQCYSHSEEPEAMRVYYGMKAIKEVINSARTNAEKCYLFFCYGAAAGEAVTDEETQALLDANNEFWQEALRKELTSVYTVREN